jgi:arylsulfatase A-like enzyme
MTATPPQFRAVLVVLVLIGFLPMLSGCGGAGPSPGDRSGQAVFMRLPLQRTEELPEMNATRVAHFQLETGSLGDWIPEAPKSSARFIPPEDARIDEAREAGVKPTRVRAAYLTGEGPKSLRIPCELEAGSFNRVAVNVRNYGARAELMSVVLWRAGKVVARSPWTAFKARGGLRPFRADFPQLRFLGEGIDQVGLETKGESNAIAITYLDLIAAPVEEFLPAIEGLGAMVGIGEEDRCCVALSSRSALEAELILPDHAELFCSFGTQVALIGPGSRARLRIRVEAEGVQTLDAQFPINAKNTRAWGEARMDLSGFADKRARIRFELQTSSELELFILVGEAAVSRRAMDAPTVLLVTSDTHRADHMGQADPDAKTSLVQTPNLDALGDRGIYFTQAYASTNVTNPSHVALMTGTSPRDTRILNNSTRLVSQAPTLAEAFQAGGYRTMAVISAYHLLDTESGLGQGFDRVNGPRRNDRDGELSVDVLEQWVEQAEGQPLFVWLHLFDAHSPYGAPAPHDETYWDGPRPFDKQAPPALPEPLIPYFLTGLTNVDYPSQQYRGEVDYVDVQMGRVLALERMNSAVIAFTADHGESFGEHGVWWDHADLYPQTVHVPLILSWPGSPEGVRTTEFVRQIDVGRTLLDLAKLELEAFPGRNLGWALDEFPAADALFELSAHGNVACVQTASWRLCVHLRNHHEAALAEARQKHQVEFFDLQADPLCNKNLAREAEHFARAKRMRGQLLQWLAAADPTGWGESQALTLEAIQSLEAMGYGGDETGAMPAGSLYEEDPANEWCAYFAR